MTLTCACGITADNLTDEMAYTLGWRLGKKGPLCPACADKRERRHYAECERRYGKARAAAAEESVRRLLG